MFRRSALSTTCPLRGRPFKKRHMPIVIHQAQRPPASPAIDFSALNLQFKVDENLCNLKTFRVNRIAKPEAVPNLPFLVDRTALGGQLPVYTETKAGGTKVVTMIRKIRGDPLAMKTDMELVCGRAVTIKPGKLQVDGNYATRLKLWLLGLGF